MYLKLPITLLAVAAVGGGVATSLRQNQPDSLPAQEWQSTSSERQARIRMAPPLEDPAAVAEQIRTAQAKPVTETPVTAPASGQGNDLSQAQPSEAVAQQPQAAPPGAAAQTSAVQSDAAQPDLSALRYFAARGDTARLQAEIARLRSLYPNWTPPDDPLAVPVGRDERLEAMWKLYADGKYAEVRKAIADRQAQEAGWQPPQDLLERLNVAETRVRLVNASDLKQYETVIDLAARTPSLRTCSDVDVLWRLGEAFTSTDRQDRALAVYRYILENCDDKDQRIATAQKASTLLSADAFAPLLALERNDEFASVRDDLARNRVAQANEKPGSNVPTEDLQRLRTLAERDGQVTDALLLGWYSLRHNDIAAAEKWFRSARAAEDSASASQGLALALIQLKRAAEAEEVMYKWRNNSEEATATYLATTANLLAGEPPPRVSEAVLARVAEMVFEKKYVPTAQQLGWYARAFNQPQTAAQWFETALSWKADDEPSAYGLAITRQQLNDRAGVAEIQRVWATRSQRIATLGMLTNAPPPNVAAAVPQEPIVAQQPRTVAVAARGAPTQPRVARRSAPAAASTRSSCTGNFNQVDLSPPAALGQGWCLMDLNRPLEAANAFETALSSSDNKVRQDAAYGQSLAYLRLGLTSKAAVAAAKAPQQPGRSAELQVAILADRANAAFNSGRFREAIVYLDQRAMFQPEPTDLMVLRAYALMKLGRASDALRIFEAVAETGNRDAARGKGEARIALGLREN
ncbi:tetratricopeptide repeat protein [Rhizobium helianthi]|uniref:Tetratricopeptide repeat protein n=1 Tax=Rhizobium helianthi TaxID=1132695 RepID=A0ABW4M8F6_9HYPH